MLFCALSAAKGMVINMNKSTDELENELVEADEIDKYFDRNRAETIDKSKEFLRNYFEILMKEKGISKAEVLERCNLPRSGYANFDGSKKASRDRIISYAIALGLDLNETQKLLRLTDNGSLYARDRRDAIIINCINRQRNIAETDEELEKHGFECLNSKEMEKLK